MLYKFLNEDGTSTFQGTKWRLPADGKRTPAMPKVKGDLVVCENGYHLCRTGDLSYWAWAGPVLYEAEPVGDELVEVNGASEPKVVVRSARLLRRLEGWNERTQRLYAADCAERVLPNYEQLVPGDTRVRDAITVARAFARGEIKVDALLTARSAAESAAESAAWSVGSAAWSAAWAATESAAWSVAESAAWAATESVAESAAESAVGSAAWSVESAARSAESAARSAERDWQSTRILQYAYGELS